MREALLHFVEDTESRHRREVQLLWDNAERCAAEVLKIQFGIARACSMHLFAVLLLLIGAALLRGWEEDFVLEFPMQAHRHTMQLHRPCFVPMMLEPQCFPEYHWAVVSGCTCVCLSGFMGLFTVISDIEERGYIPALAFRDQPQRQRGGWQSLRSLGNYALAASALPFAIPIAPFLLALFVGSNTATLEKGRPVAVTAADGAKKTLLLSTGELYSLAGWVLTGVMFCFANATLSMAAFMPLICTLRMLSAIGKYGSKPDDTRKLWPEQDAMFGYLGILLVIGIGNAQSHRKRLETRLHPLYAEFQIAYSKYKSRSGVNDKQIPRTSHCGHMLKHHTELTLFIALSSHVLLAIWCMLISQLLAHVFARCNYPPGSGAEIPPLIIWKRSSDTDVQDTLEGWLAWTMDAMSSWVSRVSSSSWWQWGETEVQTKEQTNATKASSFYSSLFPVLNLTETEVQTKEQTNATKASSFYSSLFSFFSSLFPVLNFADVEL